MKRAEWQKLKTDNAEESSLKGHNNKLSNLSFIYQFIGANNSKQGCRTTHLKNGTQQLGYAHTVILEDRY